MTSWERRPFLIATYKGPISVDGYIYGEFGVDKRLRGAWMVTHLRTGMCLVGHFATLKIAKQLVESLMSRSIGTWKRGKFCGVGFTATRTYVAAIKAAYRDIGMDAPILRSVA